MRDHAVEKSFWFLDSYKVLASVTIWSTKSDKKSEVVP